MSKTEQDFYPAIEEWLNSYLRDRYPHHSIRTTSTSSRLYLEVILRSYGIDPTIALGLQIKVDIVGILSRGNEHKLAFVEVKDKELTLKDLGQLWGYSQLMNPLESFLISSRGLGGLSRLINIQKREDLLYYDNKTRFMKLARWDDDRSCIDYETLIPKL